MFKLILLLPLFVPYFTKAALYVDVRKDSVGNINFVMSKCTCKTKLESELSESITKIIEKNLSNCGLFNIEQGVGAEAMSFKPWKSDTLVTVSLNKVSGSALELSFHLFDFFTKRELFTQSVVFPAKD
ncbi:tolB amino-terminal domain protein [Wolbachia endosymbiont of Wuchereria bancrofti]|nr:tolB amino-terminal domain protein [Wolbachia endosymbiont of Wuchereria bancrofti]